MIAAGNLLPLMRTLVQHSGRKGSNHTVGHWDIVTERGVPEQIRVDNGPEFLSKVFTSWCNKKGIKIKFIQPGRPMQNGYIELLTELSEKIYWMLINLKHWRK